LNGLNDYLGQSLEDNLSGKELAIAKALILGDKSLLDTEVKNSFTNTGAMHVLAVSGLHVGIIMQILMVFLGFFSKWIDRKTSILLVVGIMWIYAVLTGLSPSVLRAVFMFSVLVLAQISGKQHDSVNSLFFTAFVIFLFDPYTLFDIGFQLSFLAMLGIFLFYRQIEEVVFIDNKWIRKVWQGTAIGFAAQIMTTPLSLYYFHQFPNYFILTNIGLMASSGLILGLGIFIFSITWLKPLAKFAGLILGLIIYLSLLFIEWVERLPGAVAYGFEVSLLVVLFMGILALILFRVKENRKIQFAAFAIAGLMLISMVYRRYQNLDRDEVCVFNHKKLVVAVKKDAQIVCFYHGDKDDLEKIKFICEGYRKLRPGEIRYMPLDKVNYTAQLGDERFTIKRSGNDYELSIGERKMIIAFGDNSSVPREGTVIGMPWVTENTDHNLGDGAYLLTF
jgi:competence protein ComEC